MNEREFDFKDEDFKNVVQLVAERTGIVLADNKKNMVYGRLARRLRELKINKFSDYLDHLQSNNGQDEIVNFVNAITTNLTSFFREKHHFDHLKYHLEGLKQKGEKRIRIWSAASSSGQEPYSIAMVVLDVFGENSSTDIKILATDIDTNMLSKCKTGIYDDNHLEGIPSEYAKKFVVRTKGQNGGEMSKSLKKLLTFNQLNLLENWPMKGLFDIVFCRNVVIYFSRETQKILFDRMANVMKPDSIVYIGHSENLFKVSDRFQLIGRTTYKRVK